MLIFRNFEDQKWVFLLLIFGFWHRFSVRKLLSKKNLVKMMNFYINFWSIFLFRFHERWVRADGEFFALKIDGFAVNRWIMASQNDELFMLKLCLNTKKGRLVHGGFLERNKIPRFPAPLLSLFLFHFCLVFDCSIDFP